MPRFPLRVGLFGFGRAGRAVAQELIGDDDIDLVWVARRRESGAACAGEVLGLESAQGRLVATGWQSAEQLFERRPVDFVVDFSGAGALAYYGWPAARRGIGIVSAVSSYPPGQLALLRDLGGCTRVLHSPNITLGINFLMVAACMLKRMAPQVDVEIIEEHFRDKPGISGTAKRLAECLALDVATQVNSIRVGDIVGRHEVVFGLPCQTIRFIHESQSRNAFGQGALYALKQLAREEAGFYSMEQLVLQEFRRTAQLLPVDLALGRGAAAE